MAQLAENKFEFFLTVVFGTVYLLWGKCSNRKMSFKVVVIAIYGSKQNSNQYHTYLVSYERHEQLDNFAATKLF